MLKLIPGTSITTAHSDRHPERYGTGRGGGHQRGGGGGDGHQRGGGGGDGHQRGGGGRCRQPRHAGA